MQECLTKKINTNKLGITPEAFFPLVGKITLMHAGIEHDLKNVLAEDWKILHSSVEGLYGFKLRKFFLEKMKLFNIPEKDYDEYSELIDRYWIASEKRNKIIKASYGLLRENGEVFRYNVMACGEYDPKMNISQWLEKGGKLISLEELEFLIKELSQIREAIFQLSRKIYIERLKEKNWGH